jgi:outer membrane lipoprotein-sorting protein
MRKLCCVVLALGVALALAGQTNADDPADARAIIDKAINALGGKDKLAQLKAQTWSESGTYYGQGKGLPYTGKYALQFPNQFRMEIEGVFTMVVNGDQGWLKSEKGTEEMTKEQLASEHTNLYAGWVATLIPLDDKAYTLAPLEATKIDDKPVVGVKVSRKEHSDVKLYFDKATNLLVRSESTVRSQEAKGKEVKQEVTLSDYQDVSGTKVPGKIAVKRDGKLYVEAKNQDFKVGKKLDDKVFAKP